MNDCVDCVEGANSLVCRVCGEPLAFSGLRRNCKAYPCANLGENFTGSRCLAGSELKAILGGWPFRFSETGGCACSSRAAYMDAKGCDWCDDNIHEIVGWLKEEATKRGLPFLDAIGRMLVRRAIANARRNAPTPSGPAS